MRKLVTPDAANQQSHRLGQSLKHESADKQVQGLAAFVDDLPEPSNLLYAYPVLSPVAHGKLLSINKAQLNTIEGIIALITHEDIPGSKDIGPVFSGDPLLAYDEIHFLGQPIALVVAEDFDTARRVARKVAANITPLTARLDIKQAIKEEDWIRPPHSMRKHAALLHQSKKAIKGQLNIGGQEHFYLEGQIALAEPTEDGGMLIKTSSQHPSEVQTLVAEVLATPFAQVTVEMRRMGGAFGGKETQAAQWACLAALAAKITGMPVKCRLARADDMRLTGKRHPFTQQYQATVDDKGKLQALDAQFYGHCGYSPDLSDAIVDRAMFHALHAYDAPNVDITGFRARLNTQSHTAFRGFGGPQGMLFAETLMDDIAYAKGIDPLSVRLTNLAKAGDTTHYGQALDETHLPDIIQQLSEGADFIKRKAAIEAFNEKSPIIKKGIALTPVKFGISFTAQHLNQAGALIHIYTDGSVHLNHGGTEMGQGLNTKVAQIVSLELGVPFNQISISATRTDKVPNTSPTAASSGTDLNGMAALNACKQLKARLTEVAQTHFDLVGELRFEDSLIKTPNKKASFVEVVQKAYFERVSLSATGFYKTPKIHYDRETSHGRPFFYYAEGAAISEVSLDTLTGENRVERVDILHDVGQSINPALDKGQIEGAFIQGMGWLTMEKLQWNEEGRLLSTNPATYKIPSIGDTPPDFNVSLFESKNIEATVFRSKAVGEPPFMLAISVHCALRHAIASINDYCYAPRLDAPATCEALLNAVTSAKRYRGEHA